MPKFIAVHTVPITKENWLKMFADEDGVEVGSMCMDDGQYFGSIANKPEEERLDEDS